MDTRKLLLIRLRIQREIRRLLDIVKPETFKASSISENRRNYNRVTGFEGKLKSQIQTVKEGLDATIGPAACTNGISAFTWLTQNARVGKVEEKRPFQNIHYTLMDSGFLRLTRTGDIQAPDAMFPDKILQ